MEWVKFIIVAGFLVTGLALMILEIIGVFKFDYVLNRMHCAAMGDTLGLMACLLALLFITGFSFTTAKIILVIACLWITSPVASHLISRLEVTTNEDIEDHLEKRELK